MDSPPPPPRPPIAELASQRTPRARAPVIALVVIDGVRPRDVFQGPERARLEDSEFSTREQLVPVLQSIEREGVALGAPGKNRFLATGPNFVSLPGYMEILSGSRRSGCTENDCTVMRKATLLDDFHARENDPTRAAVFSSWTPLERAAAGLKGSGVVSAGPLGGYNHEVLLDYPASTHYFLRGREENEPGGLRKDATTGGLARAFLREASPEFVFISLGETDEHAHENDYPGYLRALKQADSFIGDLQEDLKRLERLGRDTALFVTTDHGRADHFTDHGRKYPESSGSFLFATGSMIRKAGDLNPSDAALCDLAPTIRELALLPARDTPDQGRVLREILAPPFAH